jgi:hypothetical protein
MAKNIKVEQVEQVFTKTFKLNIFKVLLSTCSTCSTPVVSGDDHDRKASGSKSSDDR